MNIASITTRQLIGADVVPYIPDLARLRIQVFREYPYLYDGDEAYEEQHLHRYSKSANATIVLVLDGDQIVGASTGIPITDDHETYRKPFLEHGYDVSKIFYFGESVLLPEYRGKGLYKHLMSGRESHARMLGRYNLVCFCSVVRPEGHVLKPVNMTPMDEIWPHYGYTKHPELITFLTWKDIDKETSDKKPMVFWTKSF